MSVTVSKLSHEGELSVDSLRFIKLDWKLSGGSLLSARG